MPITTAGDRDRKRPFGQIGARGVFVKEIEEALLAGRIDVAVHSAKDMTSTDADGLAVGAYLARDDPRDALVGAASIRPGMRIGTASARRRAQLLALEPSLVVERSAGTSTRACGSAGARARRDRARRPAGSTGSGSPARSGCGSPPRPCSPRRRRERSRSRFARARRSSSRTPTTPRRGAASRPSAPCVATIGAGCLAPVAAHHDGDGLTALVADEDGAWVERRSGPDPRRSRRSSSPPPRPGSRGVRVDRDEAARARRRRWSSGSRRSAPRSSSAR